MSKAYSGAMDSAAAAPRPAARSLHIGKLAAATGLTPDTLRFYERKGLLDAPRRSAGWFPLFGPEAVDRVRFVKQAQTLGLALDEIRQLVDAHGARGLTLCRQVQPLLRAHLAELDARLSELRGLRRTLKRSLDDCERQLASRPDAEGPVVHDLERGIQRPSAPRRHTSTPVPRQGRRTP